MTKMSALKLKSSQWTGLHSVQAQERDTEEVKEGCESSSKF